MIERSTGITSWSRVACVGIALALSSTQVAAETLTPNDDAGGPGGGSGSAEVFYLVVDEHGNEFVIDGVVIDDYVRGVVRENQALRSMVLIEGKETSNVWTFELNYEHGRPVEAEQAGNESAEQAAAEAQTWPNFDSTGIVVQQPESIAIPEWVAAASGMRIEEKEAPPAFSLTQNGQSITLIESKEAPVVVAKSAAVGGYFAIVDEQGSAVVPELVAAGSTERVASAGSAFPTVICVACATFR